AALRTLALHGHLRQPPRRPVHRTKGAVGRHLDEAAAIGGALAELHEAVMAKMLGPTLDVDREVKNGREARLYHTFVDGSHSSAARHCRNGEGLSLRRAGVVDHRQATGVVVWGGVQLAVRRKPRRRRIAGCRPIAVSTKPPSSASVNPRITEMGPS